MKEIGNNTDNLPAPDITIRIDARYNRIHIHKNTLKAIGDPEFIQLGYLPKTKKLMILGTWVNEQKAVHLHFTKQGACYVQSKAMLDGIRQISGLLTKPESYLYRGELAGDVPAVSFSLEEGIAIGDETEDSHASDPCSDPHRDNDCGNG